MTRLSVNLNKVALLRNQRGVGIPSVIKSARTVIDAGARGITVHPRPDGRHIRVSDVHELAGMLDVELNIEGNPFPEWLDLVRKVRPAQATLVPDAPGQATSDHGWCLCDAGGSSADFERLVPIVSELRELGVRVSLFMDPDPEQILRVAALGAERIELYTESWARFFGTSDEARCLEEFRVAAECAQVSGLGVNAGHDLNLDNLAAFLRAVPGVLEVSIGHAFTADALEFGLAGATRAYLERIASGLDRE